jgi:hypothetical protein
MSLLTTSTPLVRGSSATVTLNKSVLFALPSVAGNAHFSNQSNVFQVIVKYISNVTGSVLPELKVLAFDMSKASPTSPMLVTAQGQTTFSISQIILIDFDAGGFVVPSSDVPNIDLTFA